MLQKLREKTNSWPAKIVFALLIFVFSFFGIEGYFQSHADTSVAKVGDYKISQHDFQDQLNQLRERLSRQQGDKYDPSYVEQPKVKQQVLDQMIDRRLVSQAAKNMGLVVSQQQLRDYIANEKAFQVNGRFDKTTYVELLRANRMTPQDYQQQVQSQLEVQQLPQMIQQTELVTKADLDQYLSLSMQTRDIHYVELPSPSLDNAKVSDAAVKAYYKAHQSDFMTKEKVSLNYIDLDASQMHVDTMPSDASIKALYKKQKQRFVQPAQREASHILISVPKNATPAQQKKALAKARMVDAKAKAGDGKNFARLAKKYSDDLGSKSQGGDLGWVQKGVTNKSFEDALFSMHKGQISKPVLGPDGYHIIWLRNVRAGKVESLAKVKPQLVRQLQKSDREQAYNTLAGKLTDKVYADPTSLKPIARELHLKLQHTDLFDRQGSKDGLASNPDVVKAAFSHAVLGQDNTSDPIKLGNDHIAVVHVDQHVPAKARPLADVSDQIRKTIIDQRVAAKARKNAQALFTKLKSQGDLTQIASRAQAKVHQATGVSRHQQKLPPALLQKVFRMPHPSAGKPQFAMVAQHGGHFALVQLDAVHAGDLSKIGKQERHMLRLQMRQADAAQTTNQFVDALRAKAKITVHHDRL